MADEFVEFDEEGKPTGRTFGGDDEDMGKEFTEIDESDLETETRIKERGRQGAKKTKEGLRRAFRAAREGGGRLADKASDSDFQPPDLDSEQFASEITGGGFAADDDFDPIFGKDGMGGGGDDAEMGNDEDLLF
jgi:hypothetical protein